MKPISEKYLMPRWEHPPERVVSLVPSITESLFTLGFGDSVVGVTDYCNRPAASLTTQVRVGGPKTPNLDVILDLSPDLVIGGWEENDRASIEALSQRGVQVWLVFPKTVDDGVQVLRQILGLYHTDRLVEQINGLQVAVDYARAAADSLPSVRYFCPIWFDQHESLDWWMTFNQDTYMDELLKLFGGVNVFSERKRLYPLAADLGKGPEEPADERDTRYPRVTAAEVIAAQPELILLPDDPFKFSEADKDVLVHALADTPAVQNDRVLFVDGSLIMWFGVRLGQALQTLPEYFS